MKEKTLVLMIVAFGFSKIALCLTNTCTDFPQKITACQPYSCQLQHPLVPDSISQKKIVGKSGDRCRYEESMPNGVKMQCQFKEASLKIVAEEWRKFLSGAKASNTSFNPMKTGECKISGYGL